MASRVKDQQRILKGKAEKYLGVAVLSELSALTPEYIRLIGVTAGLEEFRQQLPERPAPARSGASPRSLVIDGIIQGGQSDCRSVFGALFDETGIFSDVP